MAPAVAQSPQHGSATIRALDWFQFEKIIALLFEHEGFDVERFGGAHADGGIDLVATKAGVTFGVQCKHWKTWRVGVKEVRAFYGAMQDRKLRHGFMITLEGYTNDAAEFARRNGIDLMDEPLLLNNLAAVNWLGQPAFHTLITDPRKDCPKCGAEMVLRTAKKGANAGANFWGCSTFPRCKFTM